MASWVIHGFLWLGVGLAVAYLLFGMNRHYLLWLGLAFLCVAASLWWPALRWVTAAGVLLCLVFAVVEGVRYLRARLVRLRREQQEREASFAEMELALAKARLAKQQAAAQTDASESSSTP